MVRGLGTTLAIGFLSGPASAAVSPPSAEEELLSAQLEFQKGRGLETYIALREIWGLWGSVNALLVEEALRFAAEDKSKAAPVRAYAEMLSAYARLRRGDFKSARDSFRKQGYVSDFLIVGPFDNEGKSGFDRVFGPGAEPHTPLIPGTAFSGKERPARYRALPQVFPYGWVDFGYLMRPSTHICAHATTFVSEDPTLNSRSKSKWQKMGQHELRKITLWMGSDGAYSLGFNGKQVLADAAYRGFDTDRKGVTVALRPGQNRVEIKVCGAESTPMFALRLADENGNADPSLLVTTELHASEAAVENVLLDKGSELPKHPKTLQGPLNLVETIESDKRSSASDLELAARYLVLTNGDNPTVHQARDLARRAAEKQATSKRFLLLAALSEDRNAAAQALSSAREATASDDLEILLAEAHHRRTGPSPHEAFPFYDQVLAIDPDNLIALQGRVELYNAAGLQKTALVTLEAAYVRRPHSVLLTNMVASQRSSLGLSVAARAAEDQYAYQRLDDNSYLTTRMELALSRRNRTDTLHFLSRLRQADPQSLWVYTVGARVHRALGDSDRALVDLTQARSIAPDDIGVLQSLADLHGVRGERKEQLALLEEVLRLRPQEVEVRKYVDHIKPPEAPPDERYAMASEDFLRKRHAPAGGNPKRTLQELTVTTVYENGLSSQFRQVVFQPLTDASAAISRQYAFQYQADTQRVELKGARVYRADGSIDEAIESGEAAADDPSISMYTSARTYYVQFPRLEPGDVVELRYRVDDVTPRNEFADYFGDVIYMQSDEPVANAEYVLIAPKSRKLIIDAKLAGVKETESETKDSKIYRFVAKNVPALLPEANMPPWSEVLGFIHVSTYKDWNDLGAWYWGLVQEQLDLDEETRNKLKEITRDKTTDLEKVKAVYAWVTKNTRYVALEFGIYGYKPRRCVQTVNRGWGDCKDKATVIVTFLRELGIDANLVVLRTGMRGKFHSKIPSLAPFDHAIAYVPSLDLYLDGTAEHTGVSELPVMDQGALALLILDGKAKLVQLPQADPMKNVIDRQLDFRLEKNGSARFTLNTEVRGHTAPGFRAHYEAESSRKDRINEALGSDFPGVEIDEKGIKMNDLSDTEVPVSMQVSGRAPRFARLEGDTLSMPVTISTRLTPNYAALSSRQQEVSLQGFSTLRQTVKLTLPPGAEVQAAPPNTSHDSRFGSYEVKFEQQGRSVSVYSTLKVKVDRVSPQDYPAFRLFCVSADQALSHRLVVTP
jgi:tetratricopeptide (TPR) repeat protein